MTTPQAAQPIRLKRVRRRLERWRRTRPHARSPIPRPLWTAAVALARQHGLYQTARALGVDYGALKRHLEATERTDRARALPPFVELAPVTPNGAGNCVIELDGPNARLRIRVPGMPLRDLAMLSRTLAGVEA